MDINDQILIELREMRAEQATDRADFSTYRANTEGRLSVVETHVKTGITGNGTPSRLAVLEAIVRVHSRRWWYTLGGAGVITLLIEFAKR